MVTLFPVSRFRVGSLRLFLNVSGVYSSSLFDEGSSSEGD